MTTLAEQTVTIRGQRVRIRVAGCASGTPLLCLNGLGAPLELWHPLLAQLQGIRAITFDAPGTGGSQAPLLPWSIAEHARLALAVLDHLGHRETDVLGLSFGGMVAQELAFLEPSRVRRLVLASTSCGWGGVPGTPAAMLAISTPARYCSQAVFEALARQYIGGQEATDPKFLLRQAQVRIARPPSVRGYMYQLWAASIWSSFLWLKALDQPTLVLAGSADPLVPASNAQILAARLPHARTHIVRGGGHLCLLGQPVQLAPRIEQFLRC